MTCSGRPIAAICALALVFASFGWASPTRPVARARSPGPLVGAYAAEVVRVIDGDTIEVRVKIWLGQEIVTSVRLAGIDTPELRRSGCAGEKAQGAAARNALIGLVEGRSVILTDVAPDKYFGRVVGRVLIDGGEDAAATLLARGLARPYDGRGRDGWCAG